MRVKNAVVCGSGFHSCDTDLDRASSSSSAMLILSWAEYSSSTYNSQTSEVLVSERVQAYIPN